MRTEGMFLPSIELLGLKLIFLLFTSEPSIESEKCPEVLDPGDERDRKSVV